MRRSLVQSVVLVVAVTTAVAYQAWAYPGFARKTKAACASCHINPAGGPGLSDAGKAYLADASKVPAAGAGAEYVGANKCRMCHMKEHKAWMVTGHPKAMELLKGAPDSTVAKFAARLKTEVTGPADKADACLTCHVTGFKLPGGYPAADSTKNANLAFMGCEGCHGPGSKHIAAPLADKKKFISREVPEKLCVQCHTPAMSPKWDFADYKKRGVHIVPAAAPAK
jgi:hypothetical protein